MQVSSRKNDKRFSKWLYVAVIVITVAAIAVTILIGKRNHSEIIRFATEQFTQQQLILSRSAATGIKDFINRVDDDLHALSDLPVVQGMQPATVEYMELFYKGTPIRTSSRMLDKNGILRFIYPQEDWRKDLIGRDYSQDSYFKKAKETGDVVISGLTINEAGERRIMLARPVYIAANGAREFNGVIACSIDPGILAILYVSPIVSGKTGYAWVLNEDGFFLAHPKEAFMDRDVFSVRKENNPELSYDAINRIQRQMMAGEEGVGLYVSGYHGEEKGKIEKVVVYTPVHVFDKVWSMAVCAPVDEAQVMTKNVRRNDLYTLGFVILIVTAAGVFFSIALYRWGSSLAQEIEVREQAEEALRESEERFRTIFDSINDAVFIHDIETGAILNVNNTACNMYGYTREELRRLDVQTISMGEAPYTQEDAIEWIKKAAAGEPQVFEWMGKHKSGRLFWEEVNMRSAVIGGRERLLVVARDITGRKQAEKELAKYKDHLEELVKERTRDLEAAQKELIKRERLSVLGQLTATVSHEIRNPLGVIRSSSFYLQRKLGGKDEKADKHLNRIENQVTLCDSIVDELLEYSRGRHSEATQGEINPWLEKVLEEITIPEKVALVTELSPDLPMVHFDRDKMHRVIFNLVNNALQAVTLRYDRLNEKQGPYQPQVKVSTSIADNRIRIEVEDNGTGMDDETARRAFEPLFTTSARGTGLGLAIVRKIVEEHGGHVSMDSTPNRGTRVTLVIPAGT